MAVDDGISIRATIRRTTDAVASRRAARAKFGPPIATWEHDSDHLTGYGCAARLVFAGPDRVRDAATAWRASIARAEIDSDVAQATPIAFGAFTFADDSAAASVLILPRRTLVVRDGVAWQIDLTSADDARESLPRRSLIGRRRPAPGEPASDFAPAAYESAVEAAIARIRSGALEKVVLARDVPVATPGFDLEAALGALGARYRGSWIFAVDGLFGASPETLIAVHGGLGDCRVLAGTAARDDDELADAASRSALLASSKNRLEHLLAVQSLVQSLDGAVDELEIGPPYALGLPNVWHLATDATARTRPGTSALDLVARLHPTAAVAGMPRAEAILAIGELEPFDRRRYAGPVGWIDGHGDGEWAIALRSAEIEGEDVVRAYAGAGIVAASVASDELAETDWKLQPIREALGVAAAPLRQTALN